MERRANCVQKLREIYLTITSEGELPNEDRAKLFSIIQEIELIFREDVVEGLREVALASYRLRFKRLRAEREFKRGNIEKSGKEDEEANELEGIIFDKLPILIDSMVKHSRLHDIS